MTGIVCKQRHGTGVLSVLNKDCHPMFNVYGLTRSADGKIWYGPCRGCNGEGFRPVPLRVPNVPLKAKGPLLSLKLR